MSSYKEGSGWVPSGAILTDAFFSLLPWLTFAWVAKIAIDVALLAKGSWTRALRWGFAAVQVFMIGVLAAMLFGAPIIDLSSISATRGISDLQDLPFGGGIYFTVRFILLIIIGATAWDTIKVLKPEFRRKPVACGGVKPNTPKGVFLLLFVIARPRRGRGNRIGNLFYLSTFSEIASSCKALLAMTDLAETLHEARVDHKRQHHDCATHRQVSKFTLSPKTTIEISTATGTFRSLKIASVPASTWRAPLFQRKKLSPEAMIPR